jgi:hypothetical protein
MKDACTDVCLFDLGFRLFVCFAHGHVKKDSRTTKVDDTVNDVMWPRRK